jgi:hypothetical protein
MNMNYRDRRAVWFSGILHLSMFVYYVLEQGTITILSKLSAEVNVHSLHAHSEGRK